MGVVFNSPFIVPVAVFTWLAIMGVAGIISQAHSRRLRADQRIAMIQRGMTAEQIATVLQPAEQDEKSDGVKTKDPMRSLGNARRAGTVLVSVGLGIIVFGLLLTVIVQVRDVLAVSACGLIPLVIGIGFFVDYRLQQRELARFGLEVGAELPPENAPR
jgi:Flp pilus assembly protein TadB